MWTIFDNIKYLYGVNAYTEDDLVYFLETDTITKDQFRELVGPDYVITPKKPNNVKIKTKANSITITSQ